MHTNNRTPHTHCFGFKSRTGRAHRTGRRISGQYSIARCLMQAMLMILAVLSLTGCYSRIPPSSVGIKFSASNGISENLVKPQVTWVGFRQKLFIYPTSIQNSTYVKQRTENEESMGSAINATTLEGSSLPVDTTVAWHVDASTVHKVFDEFGERQLEDIEQTFIRYYAQYAVNVVSGSRSIFDLTSTERKDFGPRVKAELTPLLAAHGIIVDDVLIGEVHPEEQVQAKVRERIQVSSLLEKAKTDLQRARVEANTKIKQAEGIARLNQLRSQQADKAIEQRKLELRRKAAEGWDGKPSEYGSGTIPFTNITIR